MPATTDLNAELQETKKRIDALEISLSKTNEGISSLRLEMDQFKGKLNEFHDSLAQVVLELKDIAGFKTQIQTIIRIFSAIGLGLMMSAVWASYAAGSITADMRNQTENLANVKKDLGAQIASVKQDFTAQLANVKQDLHDQIGRADTNVNLRIDQLEKRMDRRDKEIDRRFDLLELKLEMILGKLPAPKPAALDVPK